MSLDRVLSVLDEYRDEHEGLASSEREARESFRQARIEHARELAAVTKALEAERSARAQVDSEESKTREMLQKARVKHAKEIANATKALEVERSGRAQAERERDSAVAVAEALEAENADLLARPFSLDKAERAAAEARADLRLAQREIRTVTAERDVMSKRLDDLLDHAEKLREHDFAQRSDKLHQAQRRLNTALATNTRLAAELAEEKDRAARAEQIAEQSRRALGNHAGRT